MIQPTILKSSAHLADEVDGRNGRGKGNIKGRGKRRAGMGMGMGKRDRNGKRRTKREEWEKIEAKTNYFFSKSILERRSSISSCWFDFWVPKRVMIDFKRSGGGE